MLDKDDLIFISDNSIDKMVESGVSSFNVSGRSGTTNGSGSIAVPHSLGEIPFFNAQFSTNQSKWYPIGFIDAYTNGPTSWDSVDAYTTATHIVFRGSTAGGAKTMYVRYELYPKEL